MIYLNEYEGKSIEITYNGGHGRMTVNVMQFLDNQPLTKIRKLIDLIRVSDNPDAAETFKNYCTKWLKQYEPEQKVNAKPVFFMGSTFLFDKFAIYMKNQHHVVKVNGQLHIYQDGVYVNGYKQIESEMIQHIPNLKKTQRREVLDYMELIVEERSQADARYIAFNNGVLDIVTMELLPFSSELIITNKIPWNYTPGAYNELADNTLNKLACGDTVIRALLEECIGYCFYRRNELGKAFILTGDKSNGKSTFLDCIKAILGESNISALDLKELGDRFSTSMMFGKLANIGDDIGDDFLQGSQVSIFKKVVTGNRIKAERKGQDPFEFNPFTLEGIEWSTERRSTPGKLTFKVLKDDALNFTEGCPVRLVVDGYKVFFGFDIVNIG